MAIFPWVDYSARFEGSNESPLQVYQKGQEIANNREQNQINAINTLATYQKTLNEYNQAKRLKAGDYSALVDLAALNPQAAQEARLGLERRDNVSANIASQFLRTDISRKPERYQESLAQLASMGVDVSKFPNTYSPDRAEEAMRWFVDQSKSNTDLLKEQGEQLKNRELEAKIRNEAIMARKHEQEILTNRALQGKYESETQKLRQQMTSTGNIDPMVARKVDTQEVLDARKASVGSKKVINTYKQIDKILDTFDSGPWVSRYQGTKEFIGLGTDSTNYKNYSRFKTLQGALAIDQAKAIAPVSNSDLKLLFSQQPSPDKLRDVNKEIIKNGLIAQEITEKWPEFLSKWQTQYGSTLNTDKQGRTYDEAKADWELDTFKKLGGNLSDTLPTKEETLPTKEGKIYNFEGSSYEMRKK